MYIFEHRLHALSHDAIFGNELSCTMHKHLWALFLKDVRLDIRQQFGLSGIFLYVFAAIFIIYLVFGVPEGPTWIALYWLVVVFCAVNAVLKSHTQEDPSRRLYYYLLSDPLASAVAKLLYNILLLLIITFLTLILFSAITNYPIVSTPYFVLAILLGAIGIGSNFTFISRIASETRNQSTMMMILSLPVIIPLLLPLVRLSMKSLGPLTWAMAKSDITILFAIDLLIIGLVMALFPFLARS